MRNLLIVAIALALATPALALTVTYGWEDGGSVLAVYPAGNMIATNVGAPDPVYAGLRSCKLEDAHPSGTPQAYVAWIKGLVDGNQVHCDFWIYDTTPTGEPSGRIWAHYNDDPNDVMGYATSASGPNLYPAGTGWTNDGATNYTWTMSGGHTGLVIEVRTYTNPGAIVWIDEMTVTAPDGATIVLPAPVSAVESATWTGIKALYR